MDVPYRPGAGARLSVPRLAGVLAALIAGLVVYLVGLPASVSLFGTSLADLRLPAALLVAFAGCVIVGASAWTGTWRVVDIVVASVLGVAGGLLFAVWDLGWHAISRALPPPASAILVGVWLLPGVLGGLILRRPGAATYTELVAATVEALAGNQWGFSSVWYGLVEGLGAEAVLALLLYRAFGRVAAAAAGVGAGIAVGLMDSIIYYPELSPAARTAYIVLAMVSGAVIAGLGSWLLTRALARTGALAALAAGRTAERV